RPTPTELLRRSAPQTSARLYLRFMPQTLRGMDSDRLERSCNRRDWIRFGSSAPGLERAAVYLSTCAFEPHRHDTYAIGITPDRRRMTIDVKAVELARDYLTAHAGDQISASTLEQITGTDRFTLARHFRRAFATSPDRYRTMRRLARARAAIESGLPLARAAA